MSDLRRALVIGCGRIAGGYNQGRKDAMVLTHALAYVRHKDYFLAACVEPDAKMRAAFMEKWNVPRGYSTLEGALEAERFDVASICSPTGTHLAVLGRLLEADMRAVFAEKPLDGDAIGARKLGERFAAKAVPVAVNFTRRFDPAMQKLRSEIAAKRYGALRSVVGWYAQGIMNNGVHLIDLVIYLTGRAPKVSHIGNTREDGAVGDPTVSALLDLDGVPVHFVGSGGREAARFEIELAFSGAIISIEQGGLAMRLRRFGPSETFPGTVVPDQGNSAATGYGGAMLSALDELIAWRPGARLSSDIESACEAIAIADEIRRIAPGISR